MFKFTHKQNRPARRVIAVDVTSARLAVARAVRSTGRIRVDKAFSVELEQGSAAEPEAIGAALGEAIRTAKLRGPLAMNVPRRSVVLQLLTLPKGTEPDELPEMVRFQMQKELSLRPEEAVIDFAVLPGPTQSEADDNPAAVRVLAAAVRLEVIDFYRRVARAAGGELTYLGLRPCSDHRCIQACGAADPQQCVGLVHVGDDETQISVAAGSSLLFARSAALDVRHADAKGGLETPRIVETIGIEVLRTLQGFGASEHGSGVEKFFVAGSTGTEPDVAQAAARRSGVPCELLSLEPLGVSDAGLVSAVGLAISCCDATAGFDFLSPKHPKVKRDVRSLLKATAVAIAVLLAAAGGLAARHHLAAKRARLEALTRQLQQLTEQNKQLAAKVKRVCAIEQWAGGSQNWLDHLAMLADLLPSCTRVYLTNIKTDRDRVMTFTARAADSAAISELCRKLDRAGYKTVVGQLTTGSDPYELNYPYTTEIKLIVPRGMSIDLAAVNPPPRPDDDDSVNVLARRRSRR